MCRQRLQLDAAAKPKPIDDVSCRAIRAADWEFAVQWSDGDAARELKVDDVVFLRDASLTREESGIWWFSLPATARDLTRITAESCKGEIVVGIVNVDAGYQLPQTRIESLQTWRRLFREVRVLLNTEGPFSVMSLVEKAKTLLSDSPSEIRKLDLPSAYISRLSQLFDSVIRAPLSRLVSDECLVDPGEVQRITPATTDFFIRHPETWYRKAYLRPRPVKLLDERSIEDFDVYENRFVLHFVKELILRIEKLFQNYQDTLAELQLCLQETEIQSRRSLLITNLNVETVKQQKSKAEQSLRQLESFRRNLHLLQASPILRDVRHLTSIPRPNTALRLHPTYGQLYKLYEELDQAKFSHQRITTLDEARSSDLETVYGDFCLVTLLIALVNCGFEPETSDKALFLLRVDPNSQISGGAGDEGLKLEFKHKNHPRTALVLDYCVSSRRPAFRKAIRLEFLSTAQGESPATTEVWLIPDTTWWGSTTVGINEKRAELRGVYDRLEKLHRNSFTQQGTGPQKRHKRDAKAERSNHVVPGTIIMLHPTPPYAYDDRLNYEDLRLLFTQGDNFVSDADFRRFGNCKVGALPLFPEAVETEDSIDRSVRRLMRLIRIHLFHIGVDDICWNCFSVGRVTASEGNRKYFQCPKCHLEWGEIPCPKCSTPIVKIILPRGSRRRALDVPDLPEITGQSISSRQAILDSEAFESRLAVSSVCEALDQLDGYWAICPNCGHCEKETTGRTCSRCQAKASAGHDRNQ